MHNPERLADRRRRLKAHSVGHVLVYWRVLGVLTGGWSFAVLLLWDAASDPDLFLLLGPAFGLAWMFLLFATYKSYSRETIGLAFAVPLAGVLVVAALVTGADLKLRLWLCETELKQYAANAPVDPPEFDADKMVGLFLVTGVKKSNSAFCLFGPHGFLNRYGIAYIPVGTGPLPPEIRIQHSIYGDWYTFWWKF